MTIDGWIQILLFCVVIIAITAPFGGYMTRVFAGERTLLSPVLRPVERVLYRLSGVDEASEQYWVSYAIAALAFTFAGFLSLYALQRLQNLLPFNPAGQDSVGQDLAFNTSVSFITNTNWQSYVPETTMSYLTQMAGLTVHNFASAATGIALAVALVRGFARRSAQTLGNFWVDLTRCALYILLPIAIVVGLVFVWQGMPENFNAYTDAATLEGAKQVIAQGPVASQEVIKLLGTNGGGFFNANSAHPFENPNALTNFIELVLMFAIGAGLTNLFGRMVGDQRQGWAIFAVMGVLFLVGLVTVYSVESQGNPAFAAFPVDQTPGLIGQMPDGGRPAATWRARRSGSASPTSVAVHRHHHQHVHRRGQQHAMTASLPLAGLVPMANMMLGCIFFGGVGSGLYGMLLFVIVSMFLVAGLMVGPHAGIPPRQEAGGEGGQDGHAGHPRLAAVDARLHRVGREVLAGQHRRDGECRSRTASV